MCTKRRPHRVFGATITIPDHGDRYISVMPAHVAEATRLQDGLALSAGAAHPFDMPDYDPNSLDTTRKALLTLAAGPTAFDRTFGTRDDVDPVRHLLGTAAGPLHHQATSLMPYAAELTPLTSSAVECAQVPSAARA